MTVQEKTWGAKGEPALFCKMFGHLWHNDYSRNTVIVHGEPCVRNGCSVTRFNVPDDFDPPPMSVLFQPSEESEQSMGTEFKSDIVLGKRYREEMTGIEGPATGCFFYLHGCERVNIETLDNDGVIREYTFDAPRLTRIDTEEKVTSDKTGGFQRTPPRTGLR